VIVPGGIGTGENSIGVPVLERILRLLSERFSVVVFSLFPVNTDYKPMNFELISLGPGSLFLKSVKLFWAFRSHHKRRKFDFIHGFWALPSGLLAVCLGKFFRVKSAVSILGGDAVSLPEIQYGQLRRWLPRQLVFLTLRNTDELISLTKYLVDKLSQMGFRRERVHVIPWGIDSDLFRYHEKPIEGRIEFLHIGNLNAVKDQETLLRAFKIISDTVDCRLTLIGEGSWEAYVRGLAKELELESKISFKKVMPYEDLPAVYQRAHILLHTSLSEGQCEVVTEAMSAGVVVCGTRVGLIYDLSVQCCESVEVKDFGGLAMKVFELLKDERRNVALRRRARLWTESHSIIWTVERLSLLYQ
jgi:glycosyltransferase involved in cell wall biosynthesis